MARSDLLISLVKAGAAGDTARVRVAAEAIIAEERAKNHHILADRLVRAMNPNGSQAVKFLGQATNRTRDLLVEITPRRRIEDLVLANAVRRACNELIDEQRRSSVLRAHAFEPRNRLLLTGPPGNGKTSLAEAIAESLAVRFFVVRYETMIGSFLGETASRLKRVFDYARTTPCVLFFDEFDAVGKERGDIHETGEIKRVVTSLLMQVDDLPSYTVVAAATNHAELLDRAVWRRFQLHLHLRAPSQHDLARYIERFSVALGKPLGHEPSEIAEKLGPISYAEAEEFCRDIRRTEILAMGERPLKTIVSERMKLWKQRVTVAQLMEALNARLSTPADTDTGERTYS